MFSYLSLPLSLVLEFTLLYTLQSITEYNGAAVVAMVGKDCVGIASDTRLGIQACTVATDFQKVFQMGPKYFMGLAGLGTDVQTVAQTMKFKINMYK
jgi:20S proteasome subunit beta 3